MDGTLECRSFIDKINDALHSYVRGYLPREPLLLIVSVSRRRSTPLRTLSPRIAMTWRKSGASMAKFLVDVASKCFREVIINVARQLGNTVQPVTGHSDNGNTWLFNVWMVIRLTEQRVETLFYARLALVLGH